MGKQDRTSEAGFTMVEVLVAIVVLVFGLIAVTNLMLVAATSNSVANQSSAATTAASERMEVIRNMPFNALAVAGGGNLNADVGPVGPCNPVAGGAVPLPSATYNCFDDIQGVGRVITRWRVTPVPGLTRGVFIQVRSEGTGALSGARSRAEFTTLRTCTDSTPEGGCPNP